MMCRHCHASLEHTFVDLGHAPPSNAYLKPENLQSTEAHYPLRVKICTECWLLQTEDYTNADTLFDADYAYFSSTSPSWLKHASNYVNQIVDRLKLASSSLVIEVASNDGYLLKNFVAANINCLGIEPTLSTASVAQQAGIPVINKFFGEALGRQLAAEGKQADLLIGNNVFAHVPDINDFARGLKAALKPNGTITLEFPHLMRLLDGKQFDTIYHEHFSYLSLFTTERIFKRAGLKVWDVDELSTHGGSIRVYGCHAEDRREISDDVQHLLSQESERSMQTLLPYAGFQEHVERIRDDFKEFLCEQRESGKKVAAYGAAAKGNTLLNFAEVTTELLPAVYDASPAKQGQLLPGSHIPVKHPDILWAEQPDFLLILPWNLAREISDQYDFLRKCGTKFVTAIPDLRIF